MATSPKNNGKQLGIIGFTVEEIKLNLVIPTSELLEII